MLQWKKDCIKLSLFFFVFQWATGRMERGAKENNHLLYKPYSLNGTCVSGCVNTVCCYTYGKMIYYFCCVLICLLI